VQACNILYALCAAEPRQARRPPRRQASLSCTLARRHQRPRFTLTRTHQRPRPTPPPTPHPWPCSNKVIYKREGEDFQLRFSIKFEGPEEVFIAFAIPFSTWESQVGLGWAEGNSRVRGQGAPGLLRLPCLLRV